MRSTSTFILLTLVISPSSCLAQTIFPVNVRVEGANNRTIFEGLVLTNGHNVITASGGMHSCDGTNSTEPLASGPTMTSALDNATFIANPTFKWDGPFVNALRDYNVTAIGVHKVLVQGTGFPNTALEQSVHHSHRWASLSMSAGLLEKSSTEVQSLIKKNDFGQLKTLAMIGDFRDPPDALYYLKGATNIEDFKLADISVPLPSDRPSLTKLTKLSLIYCYTTGEGIRSMLEDTDNLQQLTWINVQKSFFRVGSSESISNSAITLPHLDTFNYIPAEFSLSLPNVRFPSLTCLRLRHLRKSCMKDIIDILHSSSCKLTRVHIDHCTHEAVLDLVKELHDVEELSIIGCSVRYAEAESLTWDPVINFNAPKLRSLEISVSGKSDPDVVATNTIAIMNSRSESSVDDAIAAGSTLLPLESVRLIVRNADDAMRILYREKGDLMKDLGKRLGIKVEAFLEFTDSPEKEFVELVHYVDRDTDDDSNEDDEWW